VRLKWPIHASNGSALVQIRNIRAWLQVYE